MFKGETGKNEIGPAQKLSLLENLSLITRLLFFEGSFDPRIDFKPGDDVDELYVRMRAICNDFGYKCPESKKEARELLGEVEREIEVLGSEIAPVAEHTSKQIHGGERLDDINPEDVQIMELNDSDLESRNLEPVDTTGSYPTEVTESYPAEKSQS